MPEAFWTIEADQSYRLRVVTAGASISSQVDGQGLRAALSWYEKLPNKLYIDDVLVKFIGNEVHTEMGTKLEFPLPGGLAQCECGASKTYGESMARGAMLHAHWCPLHEGRDA